MTLAPSFFFAMMASKVCKEGKVLRPLATLAVIAMNSLKPEIFLVNAAGEPLIRKTPGVCGGDACIRNTRIMVWLVTSFKRKGLTDQQLLYNYPSLTIADLEAAWEYSRQNSQEIEDAIRANEEDQE